MRRSSRADGRRVARTIFPGLERDANNPVVTEHRTAAIAERDHRVSLISIKVFEAAHPDVPVYTAAIDEPLDEKSYIVPGLGDAADRLSGTK